MSASCLYKGIGIHDRGLVMLAGSWQLNGTGAISNKLGTGFSVARSAAGVFDITWDDPYAYPISIVATVQHTTEVDAQVTIDAISSTAKTAQIRLQDGGADADLAAGRINFIAVFQKT